MAVFTSAYRQLAHGALNWDTQLDADMATLETILDQSSWTPVFGGTGVSLGTGGTTSGYFTRLGQHVSYNGRLAFGSSCSWGTGTPALTGLTNDGNFNTAFTSGTGVWLRAAGGNPIPLVFAPLTGSSVSILVVQAGASGLPWSTQAVAQSDQVIFHIDGILA